MLDRKLLSAILLGALGGGAVVAVLQPGRQRRDATPAAPSAPEPVPPVAAVDAAADAGGDGGGGDGGLALRAPTDPLEWMQGRLGALGPCAVDAAKLAEAGSFPVLRATLRPDGETGDVELVSAAAVPEEARGCLTQAIASWQPPPASRDGASGDAAHWESVLDWPLVAAQPPSGERPLITRGPERLLASGAYPIDALDREAVSGSWSVVCPRGTEVTLEKARLKLRVRKPTEADPGSAELEIGGCRGQEGRLFAVRGLPQKNKRGPLGVATAAAGDAGDGNSAPSEPRRQEAAWSFAERSVRLYVARPAQGPVLVLESGSRRQVLTTLGPSEADAGFGVELAGDVNGDGELDMLLTLGASDAPVHALFLSTPAGQGPAVLRPAAALARPGA